MYIIMFEKGGGENVQGNKKYHRKRNTQCSMPRRFKSLIFMRSWELNSHDF